MSKAIDPERSEAERTLWHTLDEAGWSADQIEEHFAAYRNAYAHELAEKIRDFVGPWSYPGEAEHVIRHVAGWRSAADLIDPEVSG
ncbi:hypothetical protein ACIO1C_29580 [Streptomyces sp. NPDC087420]|uniref:hypothetical protein n=1 Tax=Streptomyces sp. NPDC087420 TaxID=3365785 RepID=UPI003838C605